MLQRERPCAGVHPIDQNEGCFFLSLLFLVAEFVGWRWVVVADVYLESSSGLFQQLVALPMLLCSSVSVASGESDRVLG